MPSARGGELWICETSRTDCLWSSVVLPIVQKPQNLRYSTFFHAHLPSASLALLIFVRSTVSHTTHATAAFPLKISRAFQFFQHKSCDLSHDHLTFCPLRPSHAPVRSDRASDPCDRSEKQMILRSTGMHSDQRAFPEPYKLH